MRRPLRLTFFLLIAILSISARGFAQTPASPIRLTVDLREAPRRIFHARLTIPVKPGPLHLLYPKWIPGEHAPDGPIADLVGLKFVAGGKTIPWRRDELNVYSFSIEVPQGVTSVEATYDYLSPAKGEGFSAGPTADPVLAVLEWNLVVLYPAGSPTDALTYQASVRLPTGWNFASALPVERQRGEQVDFSPVSLTTLVDSPVLTGEHFRSVNLAADVRPPHHLNIAADSEAALQMTADQISAYSRLVREAGALFGTRHYNHYDFLLSLTDYFNPNGLEHHQSSDDRAPERMFLNPDQGEYLNSLLSHEFMHSWNGKYRRPAGLATPDFEQPMKGTLLWVYEGLTEYLGQMISARAGLRTQDDFREELAATAARLDHWPGRTWRPLGDTAVSAQFLYAVSSRNWSSWRRSVDFYDESALIWLEADVIIRRNSHGQKSLDDFCRKFYGGPAGDPKVIPYTLNDVIAALNDVMPYDWVDFVRTRVDEISAHPPLAGIGSAGWTLVYNSTPNQHLRARDAVNGQADLSYSLGMVVLTEGAEDSGRIADVIPGTPAARAGLSPAMRITSINGREFSPELLNEAVRAAQENEQPIVIGANNASFAGTYPIAYQGGPLYPHLERDTSQTDLLTDVLRSLTPADAGN